MAAELEQALAQGVKDSKVPHAIVFATNKDGQYSNSHPRSTLMKSSQAASNIAMPQAFSTTASTTSLSKKTPSSC